MFNSKKIKLMQIDIDNLFASERGLEQENRNLRDLIHQKEMLNVSKIGNVHFTTKVIVWKLIEYLNLDTELIEEVPVKLPSVKFKPNNIGD